MEGERGGKLVGCGGRHEDGLGDGEEAGDSRCGRRVGRVLGSVLVPGS